MSTDATDSDAPKFPERFLRYATREFGQEGEAWLEELPSILRRCCDKWGLALGRPTEEIKANYIAYVEMGNGAEAVLKVGVPHDDFSSEMEALAIYEGRGINRLIDCDKALNAMLLERLRPGKMLDSVENAREQSEITRASSRIYTRPRRRRTTHCRTLWIGCKVRLRTPEAARIPREHGAISSRFRACSP